MGLVTDAWIDIERYDGKPFWFPFLTEDNTLDWWSDEGRGSLRPAPVGL
jgi:hypothetical protein